MAVQSTSVEERKPLLSVKSLSVTYGGVSAVSNVDLDVMPGSLTGLIGPNGAGKTTLLDALSGFAHCSGTVTFKGQPLDGLAPHRRQRAGLARTFQSLELYDDLTVLDNLVISVSSSAWELLPQLLWGRKVKASARVDELLDIFNLRSIASLPVTELSQGQRKLVAVARALASEAAMVLLDEPAAGLDSRESKWFGEQLEQIRASGTTILLVDHDMTRDVAYVLCNSIPAAVRAADERGWIDLYCSLLADSGIDLDAGAAWEQYRLFAVYSWVSATSTAGMGSKWQPLHIGLGGTKRATAACDQLGCVDLLEQLLG